MLVSIAEPPFDVYAWTDVPSAKDAHLCTSVAVGTVQLYLDSKALAQLDDLESVDRPNTIYIINVGR